MKNFRPLTTSLILLLALACSGLQVLCAPCVAEPAPMPCHIANACGAEGLQAGCCCLRTESSASLQFVPPAEQASVSTPLVGMVAAASSPPRSSALRSRSSRVPRPRPPLFQLYCSFLI